MHRREDIEPKVRMVERPLQVMVQEQGSPEGQQKLTSAPVLLHKYMRTIDYREGDLLDRVIRWKDDGIKIVFHVVSDFQVFSDLKDFETGPQAVSYFPRSLEFSRQGLCDPIAPLPQPSSSGKLLFPSLAFSVWSPDAATAVSIIPHATNARQKQGLSPSVPLFCWRGKSYSKFSRIHFS